MEDYIASVTLPRKYLVPFTYPLKDKGGTCLFFKANPVKGRISIVAASDKRMAAMSLKADYMEGKYKTVIVDADLFMGTLKGRNRTGYAELFMFPNAVGISFEENSNGDSNENSPVNLFLPRLRNVYIPNLVSAVSPFSGEGACFNPNHLADAARSWRMWDLNGPPQFWPNGEGPGGFLVTRNENYYGVFVYPLWKASEIRNQTVLEWLEIVK